MHREAEVARGGDDVALLLDRPHVAAARVVRVLEAHDRRLRVMRVVVARRRRTEVIAREDPVAPLDPRHLEPRVERGSAGFVTEDVGAGLREHLVARLRERLQRDLIGHRRAGHEDGLRLSEQLRRALLQREHARVLPLLLVADDGVRHRLAHAARRMRDRVRAEVDHAFTVPGRDARLRGFWSRLPSTVKATAETAIADISATVKASAVPPVAASQPASMPPAGPAPLNAK